MRKEPRKLIYLDSIGRWGCSLCGWRFVAPDSLPSGKFEDVVKAYQALIDKSFAAHRCEEETK